jgi:mannose-1-phosphate guanylyltransferase
LIEEKKIIPILLCGGSGSRLWPMSRESFPKQYLKCNPHSNLSFLQDTQNRLKKIKYLDDPIVICNADHRFIVAEQMRQIDIFPKSIILEPFGRNTAPAITVASIKALEKDDDPILLVLPADHSIGDEDGFINTIQNGILIAEKDKIVTFGIAPKGPETGYGYIECEKDMFEDSKEPIKIKKFLEKPSKDVAKELIRDKKYAWNSGIFMVKAKVALKEIKKLSPRVFYPCVDALKNSKSDLDFIRLHKESFKKCDNASFDIAIMEKTKIGFLLPMNVKWNDIGNWDAIWEISKKDDFDNALSGNVLLENSESCLMISENRLVVGLGIKNLVVIDTQDAILIADRRSSQNVKNIVSKLKNQKYEEAVNHRMIFRPWGSYLSIAEDVGWKVKRINVNPGASLSLQKHKFRTEHWVVVSGTAKVELEGEIQILKENQSTYIPLGFKHRLSNPSKEKLILIEVQSGTYLGEDDIIRFEDIYGRKGLEKD